MGSVAIYHLCNLQFILIYLIRWQYIRSWKAKSTHQFRLNIHAMLCAMVMLCLCDQRHYQCVTELAVKTKQLVAKWWQTGGKLVANWWPAFDANVCYNFQLTYGSIRDRELSKWKAMKVMKPIEMWCMDGVEMWGEHCIGYWFDFHFLYMALNWDQSLTNQRWLFEEISDEKSDRNERNGDELRAERMGSLREAEDSVRSELLTGYGCSGGGGDGLRRRRAETSAGQRVLVDSGLGHS